MTAEWRWVCLFCLACITLTAALWAAKVTGYRPSLDQVTTAAQVAQVLSRDPASKKGRIQLKTGLFIQSFSFVDANEVNLTGLIWQRIPLSLLATEGADAAGREAGKVRAGVAFPECVKCASNPLVEQYRRQQLSDDGQPEVVIGWAFEVNVREEFNYAKYPLDRHDLWLRLWPRDFDRNVVLVPDFDSYQRTGATDRFGFDRDIVPGNWKIEDTYFSYRAKSYDTRFGIRDYIGQDNFPELHFTITLSRRFANAFIVALVPLISVLVLLYSVLITATSDREKASLLGFNASGAIGAASALLFVVLLAHVSLRRELATAGLVYIEYFYLISDVAVLAVAINVYLFATGHRGRLLDWLHRDDNRIPKLAFWPVVLLLLTLVTVTEFGPGLWQQSSGSDDAPPAARRAHPPAP